MARRWFETMLTASTHLLTHSHERPSSGLDAPPLPRRGRSMRVDRDATRRGRDGEGWMEEGGAHYLG